MKESSRIRTPVKREGAERYLLLTLVSFATSVILTRLFLAITGYPQLGGGPLHLAHVLWGGLLLFVAALLPVLMSNRWVYTASSILAGLGVGLFIDEVGKFITQNNDYFYPAAAPIIYAFFLLTVLVYIQARRPPSRDARAELYRAIDGLGEVLDRDLEADERENLEERLRRVAGQDCDPDLAQLAQALLDYVERKSLRVAPSRAAWWERALAWIAAVERRWLTRFRFKLALTVSLTLLGLAALADLLLYLVFVIRVGNVARLLETLLQTGQLAAAGDLSWFMARTALEALVGVLLLVGVRLVIAGKERRGITFCYYGLLLALTTVNLLVFYLAQFGAMLGTLYQLGLLLGLIYYRRRFLSPGLPGQLGEQGQEAGRQAPSPC